MRGTPGTKQKLLTDWTVGLVFPAFAVVIVIQTLVDAHSAVVTMLKVFGTTNSTEPTVLTVIWFFLVGHPQVTNITMILSKSNSTTDTIVSGKQKPKDEMPTFTD